MMKQLFVAWVPFQRRSVSMQRYLGYELTFISFSFKNRRLRPVEYLYKSWKSLLLFLHQRPEVILVQLPPTPLLHLAYLYKALFDRQVKIIADCHNATFRPPWIRFPGKVELLNHCDLILVHNDWVKQQAMKLGVTGQRLCVLEDPPVVVENRIPNRDIFPHPWILCPCSFNQDEPIQAVLDAAPLAPEITFVLTGNPARAQGIHDLSNLPANIKLVGFLPVAELDNLLWSTDAVLGLTKLEGIQLSAAKEAVGAKKPMVISNTKILKEIFYQGAIYVDALEPKSIAQGCQQALSNKNELTKSVVQLQEVQNKHWLTQVSKLDKFLLNKSSV
jgi:hypothetical protein